MLLPGSTRWAPTPAPRRTAHPPVTSDAHVHMCVAAAEYVPAQEGNSANLSAMARQMLQGWYHPVCSQKVGSEIVVAQEGRHHCLPLPLTMHTLAS
jgi:hypothetical protein